jgi:hypothetical protein
MLWICEHSALIPWEEKRRKTVGMAMSQMREPEKNNKFNLQSIKVREAKNIPNLFIYSYQVLNCVSDNHLIIIQTAMPRTPDKHLIRSQIDSHDRIH